MKSIGVPIPDLTIEHRRRRQWNDRCGLARGFSPTLIVGLRRRFCGSRARTMKAADLRFHAVRDRQQGLSRDRPSVTFRYAHFIFP
jgi:hypothetical protein